jgi:hypothetical protein
MKNQAKDSLLFFSTSGQANKLVTSYARKKPRIEIRGRWFFIVADHTRQPASRNIQKKNYSLRNPREGIIKPKLHCFMMVLPAFSREKVLLFCGE